jgi:hypothetical protein
MVTDSVGDRYCGASGIHEAETQTTSLMYV